MRRVKMLNTVNEKESKPIELTHYHSTSGWCNRNSDDAIEYLAYLGKCRVDGDMFVEHSKDGDLFIYKGHLNDGTY